MAIAWATSSSLVVAGIPAAGHGYRMLFPGRLNRRHRETQRLKMRRWRARQAAKKAALGLDGGGIVESPKSPQKRKKARKLHET